MAKNFPDLTGDGRVTRADVLKGRGVFKHGGSVKRMAEGGVLPKGPQNPRRSPEQAAAARKEREALKEAERKEKERKMREAYEKAMRESTSGMKHGGSVKKMNKGGPSAPAPAAKPSSSALSKLGSSLARLGTGAARLTGMTSIPGVAINTAIAAKDIYDRYRDAPDTLPVQPPQRFYEEFYPGMRKGGKVKSRGIKKYAVGGSISSASRRADGIASKGKTRGRIV